MAYATQTDLLQRLSLKQLVELTDDAKTGQVDATVVANELNEASGIVEAYTRDRYQVPLQASQTITGIVRDIAIYQLMSRRPQAMSETVRQRYEDAMTLLKAISSGTAALDQQAGAAPQSTSAGPVLPTCTGQKFTRENLEGYV